jgi:hypothetical protein
MDEWLKQLKDPGSSHSAQGLNLKQRPVPKTTMFELEALLLGIEPITALAVGAGAILLAPLADAVGDTFKEDERIADLGESITTSARQAAKDAMIWGLDLLEDIQSGFAEAQESFNDLLAEAREAREVKRSNQSDDVTEPRSIDITAD